MGISFHLCFATVLIDRTQVHMATFAKISLPQSDKKLFSDAFKIIEKMDNTFSTYNKKALVYQLNENKFLANAPDELLALLTVCKKLYIKTQGYFSIAIGAITKKLYHFGEKNARIAQKNELDMAKSDLLGFEIEHRDISLKSGVTLDFGGVAKGYSVDQVKNFLTSYHVTPFRVALSGDIYCKGSCRIAIQSPFIPDGVVTVLDLKDSAISTSGNYERYIKSKKYNHLINPKTKESEQNIASMTLFSKVYDNTTLDALATALTVMPHETRMHILSQYPAMNYLFITNDKKIYHNIKNIKLSQEFKDEQ